MEQPSGPHAWIHTPACVFMQFIKNVVPASHQRGVFVCVFVFWFFFF